MIRSEAAPLMVDIAGQLTFVHVSVVRPHAPQKTIILLHDLAGRSDDFAPLTGALAAMGFKVVAPDLPGRGRSARLAEDEYSLRSYGHVLHELLQAHSTTECWLFGQGWGAMMAVLMENLIDHPFDQVVLADLPASWSFDTDPVAAFWAKCSTLTAGDVETYLATAREYLPEGAEAKPLLDLLSERLIATEDGVALSLDPGLFTNLEHTATKSFDLSAGLARARSPIALIDGHLTNPSPLPASALSANAKGGPIRRFDVLRGSQASWVRDDMLAPAIGIFLMLSRSAPQITSVG